MTKRHRYQIEIRKPNLLNSIKLDVTPLPGEIEDDTRRRAVELAGVYKNMGCRILNQTKYIFDASNDGGVRYDGR